MPLPHPPDSIGADFSTLSAKELRSTQEEIWAWISAAEEATLDEMPDDELLEDARDALNAVIAERRSLHSDEPAPRGG